jgi:hypothetical protein
MIGEGFREIGVLVMVFVPIDNMFEPRPWPWYGAFLRPGLWRDSVLGGMGLKTSWRQEAKDD